MKSMELPKMSTDKPCNRSPQEDSETCENHLRQQFSQSSPNLVWVSDFTYIKAGGKWYYLCVIIDLFSRKVIAWHISSNPDSELVIITFKKAYEARNAPYGLIFHSDRGSQYTSSKFKIFWIFLMSYNLFQKRVILLIMLFARVSLSI